MQPPTDHEVKASVRFSGQLAEHIKKRTGNGGLFENTSEYLRSLVREDLSAKQGFEKHLEEIWQVLLPGAQADEKEFIPVTASHIKALGRKKRSNDDN